MFYKYGRNKKSIINKKKTHFYSHLMFLSATLTKLKNRGTNSKRYLRVIGVAGSKKYTVFYNNLLNCHSA